MGRLGSGKRHTDLKTQPELFKGEVLAITWPPDGIYRIIKHYTL